jgi:hypothetical protein
MFPWGTGCVSRDTKDLDLRSCCMGRRLVVQRMRAWFRTQLHLRERRQMTKRILVHQPLQAQTRHSWNFREVQPSQHKFSHMPHVMSQASSMTFPNGLLSRSVLSSELEFRKDRVRPSTRGIFSPRDQRHSCHIGTQ